MKLYFLLSLLLNLTNSALSMDQNDNEAEYPVTIHHKQTNQTSLTLYLCLGQEIQDLNFSILSAAQQRELNMESLARIRNKNILCIGSSQQTYLHIQFSSPKPVDCINATIRHKQGSPWARIIVPYKQEKN